MNINFFNFMRTKFLFWICYAGYCIVLGFLLGLCIPQNWGYTFGFIAGGIAGFFLALRIILKNATIEDND